MRLIIGAVLELLRIIVILFVLGSHGPSFSFPDSSSSYLLF